MISISVQIFFPFLEVNIFELRKYRSCRVFITFKMHTFRSKLTRILIASNSWRSRVYHMMNKEATSLTIFYRITTNRQLLKENVYAAIFTLHTFSLLHASWVWTNFEKHLTQTQMLFTRFSHYALPLQISEVKFQDICTLVFRQYYKRLTVVCERNRYETMNLQIFCLLVIFSGREYHCNFMIIFIYTSKLSLW